MAGTRLGRIGTVSALALLAACGRPHDDAVPGAGPVRLIVAEFTSAADDRRLELALKHALSVALAQSPHVDVLPGALAIDALRAMNRSADEPLRADRAWEIAGREGLDVVVLGAIDGRDGRLLVSVDAVSARSGETLAHGEAEADGLDRLIDAVGETAGLLLARLTARPVPGNIPPLSTLTTPSFDAFAHYARGQDLADKGRRAAAAPHFEQALAADPGFELARSALEAAREGTRVPGAAIHLARTAAADAPLDGLAHPAVPFGPAGENR